MIEIDVCNTPAMELWHILPFFDEICFIGLTPRAIVGIDYLDLFFVGKKSEIEEEKKEDYRLMRIFFPFIQ